MMASDERPTSFFIPAPELDIAWVKDTAYWKWTSLTDSPGSEKVAELLIVYWLEIIGTVELKKLLRKTSYLAYLVFKLGERSYGLRDLKARVRFIREGKKLAGKECNVIIDGKKIPGIRGRLPQARGGGWMEIKLGDFLNDLGDDDDDDGRSVEVELFEVEILNGKSGLIVRGIELRPHFSGMGEEVVSSYLRSKFSSILNEAAEDPSSPSQIMSHFRSIEEQINAIYSQNSVSPTQRFAASIPVGLLHELIDALSECRVFAHELHRATASKKGFFRVYNFKRNMSRQLDEIERKLMIKTRRTRLSPPGEVIPQLTYPVTDASKIIGFESETNRIEELLVMAASTKEEEEEEEEEADWFIGIGIVGRRSGCGKTALAQKVFASPRIQEEFSPKIWVCLSDMLIDNERLDPRMRVLIHILEKIGHNVSAMEDADFSVVKLLEKLQSGLMGKRYLIILDDAWRVDEWFADLHYRLPRGYPMGEFFSHGLPKESGGAIIVTSQLENVVKQMVGDKHVIRLEDNLSDDICWRIFSDLVRQQGKVNPDDHQMLKKLEEDVIRKCDGLCFGAKILADIIPNLL